MLTSSANYSPTVGGLVQQDPEGHSQCALHTMESGYR